MDRTQTLKIIRGELAKLFGPIAGDLSFSNLQQRFEKILATNDWQRVVAGPGSSQEHYYQNPDKKMVICRGVDGPEIFQYSIHQKNFSCHIYKPEVGDDPMDHEFTEVESPINSVTFRRFEKVLA